MLLSWKKGQIDTDLANQHGNDIYLGDDVSLRPEIYEFLQAKSMANLPVSTVGEHAAIEKNLTFSLDARWLGMEQF